MRILHVHRIAHIPQLLVRKLRERGIEASFLEEVDASTVKDYDIIHGHYALNRHTIKAFRLARRYKIPFIMHCHGSDLRRLTGTGMVRLPFHYRMISQHIRDRSVKILLSTPDLIQFEPRGEYIPNPVDLEMFRPMPGVEKTFRRLICGSQIRGSALLKFVRPDIQYDCVNAGDEIGFPANVRMLPYVDYGRLPEFFNRYEFMIGTVGDVISMARLEAMACGLRTFTDFDRRYSKFYDGQSPDEAPEPREFIRRFHNPDIAAARLIEIYSSIEENR